MDIFHAQRLADLPSVRVLALPPRTHSFVLELFDEGALVPLMAELVEGRTPDICDVNPEVDRDTEARIADTAYATQRGDWEEVVERIGPVAARHPGWAGPNYDLGRALRELGVLESAKVALTKALDASPSWRQARGALLTVLFRQNRPAVAERVAREGLALDPDWPEGHTSLARSLSMLGREAG